LDARWEGALQTEGVPSSRRCELAYVHGMDPASRARAAADPDGPLAGREADLAALTAVIERLGAYLHAIDAAPTWAGAVAALTDLAEGMLHPRSSTPGDRAAGRALDGALQVLARHEPGAANPGRHVLTRHLATELAGGAGREGQLRSGVVVGTLASAFARDLDLVIVLGLAEGIAPAPVVPDPLFPEDALEALGGAFLPARQAREEQKAQFAAALAAGRRTLVTVPRGRLRTPGPLFLSPWIAPHRVLTEQVGAVLEQQVPGARHLRSVHQIIDSPLAGARDGYGEVPGVSGAPDHGRAWHRAALQNLPHGGTGEDLPEAVRTAREIRADRRMGHFTRYTGNVGPLAGSFDVREPADGAHQGGRGISPTALEDWSHDPFDYLLSRVLGAELFTYPDEEEQA
ncbi:MAG: hypothetical protein Q4G40_11725, partial [Brachybacterium sp.]|nr:hypothetical protein [Brachybacterium sp.]